MNQAPLSPVSALVAHVESLVADRRVLVIGSADRSVAEHLLERGARLVQVLDPDPKRVAHAAAHNSERRVSYAQFSDSSLRDGSFNLVIVEDIEIGENLPYLVSGVRRSLNQQGVAIFCARNPETTTGLLGASRGRVDYDSFCDAVEDEFDASIMLGQSPFLGYSVVQFGLEQPPEPALDNAYLGGESDPPDYYMAVCGTEEVLASLHLEDMSIVQLPAARFVQDNDTSHRDSELRAARRAESLEAELRHLRSQQGNGRVEELLSELEQRDSWIRQLESRAESADARADDAQAEMERLEQELEDTHSALLNTREDADRAVSERDAEIAKREELEQAPPVAATSVAAQEEIDELEDELEEVNGQLVKALEQLKNSQAQTKKLENELALALREAKEGQHHSVGREALEEELTALDKKVRSLESTLQEKQRGQERLEKRLAEQEKEIDDLHEQLDQTEERLTRAKDEITDNQGPSLKEIEQDVRGLEVQLKERGKRISELESQLRNLELYAKTLKADLEAAELNDEGQTVPQTEVDTLARALAEREADLVAAQWTIGQLKQATLKS